MDPRLELALDGRLPNEHADVFGQLRERGDDHAVAGCLVLRATRTTEYLLHVEHADVGEDALLRVEDFGSLKVKILN